MMEAVPQCIINIQESPVELYPVIDLVDLDKKIPARYFAILKFKGGHFGV
jgi:hypothetical protein